jgi:hypothetical protein
MPITCYLNFVRIGRFAYTKIEKVACKLPKILYDGFVITQEEIRSGMMTYVRD